MEAELAQYIPEIIVGIVLMGFAWAFKGWSNSIKDAETNFLRELRSLITDFHQHRIETEKRVTKVETEVNSIHKRLDKCEIKSIRKNTED